MDDCTFIVNVDKALANLIWTGIKEDPETQALVSNENQISFDSPKTAQAGGSKKLSIFLYFILEDTTTRKNVPVDSSGKRISQASFALRYLITPCTGNEEGDHLLLGKTIQILANTPILFGDSAGNGSELSVKLDSLSLPDLNNLWTALDTPLRPCASYTVSTVSINCGVAAQENAESTVNLPKATTNINRTFELYQAVLKTFVEQSNGWKKANLFKKQYVSQDFKKNTDMSVDEMLAALNSLGDKLEMHLSTKQFIEPLNALAAFYEHQREALKGFEKISKKQQENLEIIAAWNRDVKALVDALST